MKFNLNSKRNDFIINKQDKFLLGLKKITTVINFYKNTHNLSSFSS